MTTWPRVDGSSAGIYETTSSVEDEGTNTSVFPDTGAKQVYELLQESTLTFQNPIDALATQALNIIMSITGILQTQYGDGTNITDPTALALAARMNKNWMAPNVATNWVKVVQDYRTNRITPDLATTIKLIQAHTDGLVFGDHPILPSLQGGIGSTVSAVTNISNIKQELNPINSMRDRILDYFSTITGKGQLYLNQVIQILQPVLDAGSPLQLLSNALDQTDVIKSQIMDLVANEIINYEDLFSSFSNLTDYNFAITSDPGENLILQSVATDSLKNVIN